MCLAADSKQRQLSSPWPGWSPMGSRWAPRATRQPEVWDQLPQRKWNWLEVPLWCECRGSEWDRKGWEFPPADSRETHTLSPRPKVWINIFSRQQLKGGTNGSFYWLLLGFCDCDWRGQKCCHLEGQFGNWSWLLLIQNLLRCFPVRVNEMKVEEWFRSNWPPWALYNVSQAIPTFWCVWWQKSRESLNWGAELLSSAVLNLKLVTTSNVNDKCKWQ